MKIDEFRMISRCFAKERVEFGHRGVSASPRAAMRTQQQSPTVLRVGESSGALVGVPLPIACGERKNYQRNTAFTEVQTL